MSNFKGYSKNFGSFDNSGSGLTDEQSLVLSKLHYDGETGELVSSTPITRIGQTWELSSGGDQLFFKDLIADAAMYPLMGGVKDRCIRENQDSSGIINPNGRVYSSDISSESINGQAESDPLIYNFTIKSSFNVLMRDNSSISSLSFRVEHEIPSGSILQLRVRVGSNLGDLLYTQALEVENVVAAGSIYEYCFKHPVDVPSEVHLYLGVFVTDDEGEEVYLSVSWNEVGTGWFSCIYSTYEDKEVAFTDNHFHTGLTTFEAETAGGLTTLGGMVVGGLTTLEDLTVNGTTTTINTITLEVTDKNIELGAVAIPTDSTADGGGLTLKGSTDKTILWDGSSETWNFNQNVHVEGDLSITGTFVGDGSGIANIDHNIYFPSGGSTSGSDGNTGNFGWTSLGTFPPLDTSNGPPLGFISRGSPLRLILDLGSDQKLSGMLYQNYVLTSGSESERGLRGVTVYSSTVAPSTGWNEVLGDLTPQFVGDLERETEAPHLSALKLVPFTSGTIGRYIIIESSNQTTSSWGAPWKGLRAMLAQIADSPVYGSQLTPLVSDSLSSVGDLQVDSLTTAQGVVVGTELVVGGNVSVDGMIQSGDGLNTGMGTNAFASLRVDLGAFNNTAIGSNAAFTLTSGSNNIIIGANAQTTTPTTSDQIVIGTPTQTRCIINGAIEGFGEGLTNISCSAVVREQGYLRLNSPHLLQQQGALGGSWVTSSYTDSPTNTAGIIATRGFNLLVGKTYELTCHLHGIGGFQDWLIAYWVKEGETTPCGWATKGGIQMEQSGNSGFSSITGPITTTVSPSATSRYHIWVSTTSGLIDLYSQGTEGSECTMHVKEV